MGIYIRKETGDQVIARQPASSVDQGQFELWLKTLDLHPDGVEKYSWVVYFGDTKYVVLTDDQFDLEYEETSTKGQG